MTLRQQVTGTLLAALLPIIVLTIVLSGTLVNTMQDEIRTANLNELQLYMRTLDGKFESLEGELNRTVSTFWYYITGHSANTQMDAFRLHRHLRDVRGRYGDLADCTFLLDRGDAKTNAHISFDTERYTYQESIVLQEYLESLDLSALPNRAPRLHRIGGRTYLLYPVISRNGSTAIGYLAETAAATRGPRGPCRSTRSISTSCRGMSLRSGSASGPPRSRDVSL